MICKDCGYFEKESEMSDYEYYVEQVIKAEEEDPLAEDPVCPFPGSNCECYVDRRDPKHGCKFCQDAKNAYRMVVNNGIH